MKIPFWALSALLTVALHAQSSQPSLQKIWETDTVVAVPESVLPDAGNHILYVSLIDGGPWDVDGKGGVGRLSPDGRHYNGTWITGLNAPKGMGRFGHRLYVADISEVVVIDIPKGVIEKKIPIQGATGLNDITVDEKGVVYVSDSKSGKIYRIEGDNPAIYMENLDGANGLKASGSNLYILAKKAVLVADPAKNLRTICTLPNGGDGMELVGNGDMIVSEWVGNVFYVYADGRKVQMLDRKAEHKNTADIWYDQASKTLYVPGFFGKTVAAYRLLGKP
jgi:sugar lactone lactonase YvrE